LKALPELNEEHDEIVKAIISYIPSCLSLQLLESDNLDNYLKRDISLKDAKEVIKYLEKELKAYKKESFKRGPPKKAANERNKPLKPIKKREAKGASKVSDTPF
jgi:hypothetical protein